MKLLNTQKMKQLNRKNIFQIFILTMLFFSLITNVFLLVDQRKYKNNICVSTKIANNYYHHYTREVSSLNWQLEYLYSSFECLIDEYNRGNYYISKDYYKDFGIEYIDDEFEYFLLTKYNLIADIDFHCNIDGFPERGYRLIRKIQRLLNERMHNDPNLCNDIKKQWNNTWVGKEKWKEERRFHDGYYSSLSPLKTSAIFISPKIKGQDVDEYIKKKYSEFFPIGSGKSLDYYIDVPTTGKLKIHIAHKSGTEKDKQFVDFIDQLPKVTPAKRDGKYVNYRFYQ